MKLTPLQCSFSVSICSHAVAIGLFLSVGKTPRPATVEHDAAELLVSMVAAPVEIVVSEPSPVAEVPPRIEPQTISTPAPPVLEEIPHIPDSVVAPQPVTTQTQPLNDAKVVGTNPVEVPPTIPQKNVRGDGSSIAPGTDPVTTNPQPGLLAKANYLKNPEPPYPAQARRRGQEGLVILEVRVTRLGRASEISMKQSSGFPLLDDAAIKAVREWEFDPAKVGVMPVESRIEVPVRFRLFK